MNILCVQKKLQEYFDAYLNNIFVNSSNAYTSFRLAKIIYIANKNKDKKTLKIAENIYKNYGKSIIKNGNIYYYVDAQHTEEDVWNLYYNLMIKEEQKNNNKEQIWKQIDIKNY